MFKQKVSASRTLNISAKAPAITANPGPWFLLLEKEKSCVCVWDCVWIDAISYAFVCRYVCVCVYSTCQTHGYAHPTVNPLPKQGKTPTLSLRIVCSFNNVSCLQCTVVSLCREEIQLVGWWFCIWVHHGGGCSFDCLYCILFCCVVHVSGETCSIAESFHTKKNPTASDVS